MIPRKRPEYDTIVVGTGPGGAPAALELARAGESVLLVEKGAYHRRMLGFPLGVRLAERLFVFNRSLEGVVVERGITVGGSSMIYQGNVFDPPAFLLRRMGLDFRPEVEELKAEIGVRTLPDRFFDRHGHTGGRRVREAAERMGIPFEPQQKFVDPDRCVPGCDWCMLGCPQDAKWTTRRHVDEAVRVHGAHLLTSSPVDRLLFDDSGARVTGVRLSSGTEVHGGRVLLSAGGIGTPAILLRSGVRDVGRRFFMDPMTILFGLSRHAKGGMWGEQTFSHAIEAFAESDGFMIGNAGALGTFTVMNLVRAGTMRRNWYKAPRVARGMGLFVKLAEDDRGRVYPDERVSKPVTLDDRRRMRRGVEVAREILVRAGARPRSISLLEWAGGHPGGTVEMGVRVGRDFRGELENLYVCDASLLPVSPGSPPSLSIMGMSRLLARFLLGSVRPEERFVAGA